MNKKDMVLIKKALTISAQKEIKALELLPEVKFTPSESYKNKMQEILRDRAECCTYEEIKRKKLAVAMIAAVIIVSFLTACAVIKPIRNFFVETFDEYFSFTAVHKEDYSESQIENCYTLKYVPDGFILSLDSNKTSKHMICYNKNNEELTFYQMLCLNGGFEIDYKNTEINTVIIKDHEMMSFTKSNQKILYWEDGTYIFSLAFPESLPNEEVEKIIAGITAEE